MVFKKLIYNFQRFDPETTNGEGPYWLKNLYFVYLLELRALAKAAPYLRKQSYFTGNKIQNSYQYFQLFLIYRLGYLERLFGAIPCLALGAPITPPALF